MIKHLLTVLTLLGLLTITAAPAAAATTTAPQAPEMPKKYYDIWQKMTLRNMLRQQSSVTPTPTPTPKTASTTANNPTPTPTKKPMPTPTKTASTTPAATAPATNDVTAFIMNEINAYRTSQGLGKVQTSTETCNFAKIRAQEISTNFSHDGFTSRKNSRTLPYASWTAITENIAMTSNYKDVVTMWKNSSGHAANMRANTPYVCVMQHGNYYAYEGMKP